MSALYHGSMMSNGRRGGASERLLTRTLVTAPESSTQMVGVELSSRASADTYLYGVCHDRMLCHKQNTNKNQNAEYHSTEHHPMFRRAVSTHTDRKGTLCDDRSLNASESSSRNASAAAIPSTSVVSPPFSACTRQCRSWIPGTGSR